MSTRLNSRNLATLARGLATPRYDRSGLSGGILHFGVGNFHRAHQAVYLDDLFNLGLDRDWAIVGAGVLEADAAAREKFASQDWLATIVEQDSARMSGRITGAMVDYLDPRDREAIAARLADPAIRIVSMTITEGGYFIDPATGTFNPAHPAIAADGANPAAPRTVFGLIVAGLKLRRSAGVAPFTVMCCDNIPHNGVVTRNAVVGLARLSEPGLADWIEREVAFPNGMVDRITPATGDRERRLARELFGVEDEWPVFCETFRQWVLEDNFPAGRPALEKVGVQFVPDVTPYEHMKIRILNGGHALIAYPAGLLDIEFVHEAMQHPLVLGFLRKVEREEIIPVLPPVPDTNLDAYYALIEERFANPRIGDTVRRLCLDGSNRQPKFIVPGIADRLARGEGIEGLALASALWCRYCYGVSEAGRDIAPNDPWWSRLQQAARAAKGEPGAWLAMDEIYGKAGAAPALRETFGRWLRMLWAEGTEATLRRYLGS